MGRSGGHHYPVVQGSAIALPVESDSVDVVVLPHILEFEAQPHEALRESARVIVPRWASVDLRIQSPGACSVAGGS